MLVSVVASGYNAEKFVDRFVENYLSQSYQNIELILFDDASTDNTRQKMLEQEKKNPGKVIVRWNEGKQNLGPGGGKDKGASFAHGDYVVFADFDDPVEHDYIEGLVQAAKANDMPDLVIGGFRHVDSNGKVLSMRGYPDKDTALYQAISNCTKMFRRKFLIDHDLHIPAGKVLDDVMFQSFVVVQNPTVAVCPKYGYHYLENPLSVSNTYLNHFGEGILRIEMTAMAEYQKRLKTEEQRSLFTYYVFRLVCWHLLKSGCGVPVEEMKREYEAAFSYLEQDFPQWRHCKYISWLRPKRERPVVRMVTGTVSFLHKIHLSRLFFSCYARAKFLKRFWPSM